MTSTSWTLTIGSALLAATMALAGGPAEPAYAAAPAALSDLEAAAMANNPRLAAMRAHLEAARAQTAYVGTLEAPKAAITIMDVPSLGGPSFSLSRMLPGPGKLRLASEAARYDADQAEAELVAETRMVASGVAQAFYEGATMRRMLAIRQRIQAQLAQLLKIAAARYAVGMGLQQDPLMVQRETTRLHRDLIENERAIATARARLNTLANRPLDAALEFPADLPSPVPLAPEAALVALADAGEPTLRADRARAAAARVRLALARTHASTPDFDVALQAGRTMPGDMGAIGGMVGMQLPWLAGDRLGRMVTEAERMQAEAEARVQARANEVLLRIRELRNEIVRSDRQIALSRSDTKRIARQSLAASLAAYQVGKADITTVLVNQRAIFEADMDETTALGDRFQAAAMLEALTGPLDVPTKRGTL